MKSLFKAGLTSLALALTLAILTCGARASSFGQHADPYPTAQKDAKSAASPIVVMEVDLEGLKKLLNAGEKSTRPLLVNFWATWCDPCRDEFPDLVKINADYRARGLDFITVSLDLPEEIKTNVLEFLNRMKATMPAYLLNVSDPEPAIKSVDAEWSGALPATFLFSSDRQIAYRHFGRVKPAELRAEIDKVLEREDGK